MVLSQDKVHLLLTLQLVLKNALMSLVKGFFALFPKNKKKCEGGFALGVGTAPRVEPIHAGCSAGGLRRVGAAQGWRRWQVLLLEQAHSSDCLEGTSWCRGCLVRYSGRRRRGRPVASTEERFVDEEEEEEEEEEAPEDFLWFLFRLWTSL